MKIKVVHEHITMQVVAGFEALDATIGVAFNAKGPGARKNFGTVGKVRVLDRGPSTLSSDNINFFVHSSFEFFA